MILRSKPRTLVERNGQHLLPGIDTVTPANPPSGHLADQTNSREQAFTAKQLACGLRTGLRGVYYQLEKISPKRTDIPVCGNMAYGWSFDSLPPDWQGRITMRARDRRFASGTEYLKSIPTEPWFCKVPYKEVQQPFKDKAEKLQKALEPTLKLVYDCERSAAEIERAALDDFGSVFGYRVSERHLRRLIDRTVERDGGRERWHRPELYLDEAAIRLPKASKAVPDRDYSHRELDHIIEKMKCQQRPTPEDRKHVWHATFHHFRNLTKNFDQNSKKGRRKIRRVKRSLLAYLEEAFPPTTLCRTHASLRRRFEINWLIWIESDGDPESMQDDRPIYSGNWFEWEKFADDRNQIRDRAIGYGGNESRAYRELRDEGKLSAEFCELHVYGPGKCNDIPRAAREEITPEVDMVLPLCHGEHEAKMRGPYTMRDWSGVQPGDWFCADDVTWNHYFKVQLENGSWLILRGECLLMTDLRTGCPLGFLLLAGDYNSEHIRSLILQVHDVHGLPRKGFYFENGIWRAALIDGQGRGPYKLGWRETEHGLQAKDLHLDIRHATTPRAKPLEGLIRILEERMRPLPGFVGFDERHDRYERMQELIKRARRGDPEALKEFPTHSEWAEMVQTVVNEFASAVQHGKMCDEKSPRQAWKDYVVQHPLGKLPDQSRYILATHRQRVTVRSEGILIEIRGIRHLYYNECTGKLIGRRVLSYYNIEHPELLTVRDPKLKLHFSVREVKLPAMSASGRELNEVARLKQSHMAYARGIFKALKHETVPVTRADQQTDEDAAFGRFQKQETENDKKQQRDSERQESKLRKDAAMAGVPQKIVDRSPWRARMATQLRQRAAAKQSQNAEASQPAEAQSNHNTSP